MAGAIVMQTFTFERASDPTGVSGTGAVAQGVIFDDGTVAVRWLSEHRSTAVYSSFEEVEAIHGHGGDTRFLMGTPDENVLSDMLQDSYNSGYRDGEASGYHDWTEALDDCFTPKTTLTPYSVSLAIKQLQHSYVMADGGERRKADAIIQLAKLLKGSAQVVHSDSLDRRHYPHTLHHGSFESCPASNCTEVRDALDRVFGNEY